MKQQIRKLVERAHIDLYGDVGAEANQAQLEHLVELVAQECMEICHNVDAGDGDYSADIAAEKIAEQFGVNP